MKIFTDRRTKLEDKLERKGEKGKEKRGIGRILLWKGTWRAPHFFPESGCEICELRSTDSGRNGRGEQGVIPANLVAQSRNEASPKLLHLPLKRNISDFDPNDGLNPRLLLLTHLSLVLSPSASFT